MVKIINHQAGRQLLFEQRNSLGTCLQMEPAPELNDRTNGYSKNQHREGVVYDLSFKSCWSVFAIMTFHLYFDIFYLIKQ